MNAPGFDTFFRFEDKTVTQVAQVIQNEGCDVKIPFRNMGKDANGRPKKVNPVCYKCAGQKQHDNMNYYVQKRQDGSYRLSSDWHHKQQTSKAPPNKSMAARNSTCLLYTSPSPRDLAVSRMPSSA